MKRASFRIILPSQQGGVVNAELRRWSWEPRLVKSRAICPVSPTRLVEFGKSQLQSSSKCLRKATHSTFITFHRHFIESNVLNPVLSMLDMLETVYDPF